MTQATLVRRAAVAVMVAVTLGGVIGVDSASACEVQILPMPTRTTPPPLVVPPPERLPAPPLVIVPSEPAPGPKAAQPTEVRPHERHAHRPTHEHPAGSSLPKWWPTHVHRYLPLSGW
ncbi:hypothetical protein FB474_0093 [Oryzihumus leptocrescens]|uniref:Uncharacterized protein n=1 Tax=Oryzihumus leptocrescens TaxID=297536 RepID=A0A542ZEI4_9MICO|nr:hypothetical protein FB474_0093 [Oryzihumus leptocrescens]